MTMRITMTQSRMGEAGSVLAAGSTNTVSKAFGAMMVGLKYAIDTDGFFQPAVSQLPPLTVPLVLSVVSGESARLPQRVTTLFEPGDGKVMTVTPAAGATVGAIGTEVIDGEVWRTYTITGISAINNYVDVITPNFDPITADTMALQWRSNTINSGISVTTLLGTAAYATLVYAGNQMSAASYVSQYGHTGTIGVPIAPAEWTKVNFSNDTHIQAWTTATNRLAVPNGLTVTFKLRAMYVGFRRRKGRLVVTGDDGTAAYMDLGVPILTRYGIPSTVAVIADMVGNASGYFTTEAKLQAFVAQGNMCVAHGPVTGIGDIFSINATDDAALADMQYHRDWLVDRGLTNGRGSKCYIWPTGRWSRTVGDPAFLDRAWNAGFKVGRMSDIVTLRYGSAPVISDRRSNLMLPTLGHLYAGVSNTVDDVTETANINNIIARIQALAAAGLDSFLVFHEVVARGAANGATKVEADRLHTICAAIQTLVAAATLECITMDALVP